MIYLFLHFMDRKLFWEGEGAKKQQIATLNFLSYFSFFAPSNILPSYGKKNGKHKKNRNKNYDPQTFNFHLERKVIKKQGTVGKFLAKIRWHPM